MKRALLAVVLAGLFLANEKTAAHKTVANSLAQLKAAWEAATQVTEAKEAGGYATTSISAFVASKSGFFELKREHLDLIAPRWAIHSVCDDQGWRVTVLPDVDVISIPSGLGENLNAVVLVRYDSSMNAAEILLTNAHVA
jgi:hypothetical protein